MSSLSQHILYTRKLIALGIGLRSPHLSRVLEDITQSLRDADLLPQQLDNFCLFANNILLELILKVHPKNYKPNKKLRPLLFVECLYFLVHETFSAAGKPLPPKSQRNYVDDKLATVLGVEQFNNLVREFRPDFELASVDVGLTPAQALFRYNRIKKLPASTVFCHDHLLPKFQPLLNVVEDDSTPKVR